MDHCVVLKTGVTSIYILKTCGVTTSLKEKEKMRQTKQARSWDGL